MKNNILTLLLLLVVTPKTFSQVPFWCTQVSVTYEVVDDNLILKGYNTENMENATDTTTFVFNFNSGTNNITDTCFTHPNDSIIISINKNDVFEICNYTLIYSNYPTSLTTTCPVTCVEMIWDGIILEEYDDTISLGIDEVNNVSNTFYDKIYDIYGRELNNIESLPYGTIYIKEGKKYYKN